MTRRNSQDPKLEDELTDRRAICRSYLRWRPLRRLAVGLATATLRAALIGMAVAWAANAALAQHGTAMAEGTSLLQRLQEAALGKSTAPNRNAAPATTTNSRPLLDQPSAGDDTPPAEPIARPNPLLLPAGEAPDRAVVVPIQKPPTPENIAVREDNGLISLMVREGSLRQVVSLIAETQNQNIVFAGANDAMITASFDRVPWQQVLDSLLAASGHASTINDNIIFVSPVDAASFVPPGAEGRVVRLFELDFASAVDVDQSVQGLLSPAGQSWVQEINTADNRRTREAVIVVDYPRYLARIHDFICQSDQPPRQVMIEAHILEVDLNDECRHGVNFDNIARLSSTELSLRTAGFANAAASPSFFIEPTGGALTGLVELIKSTTDAKTLASPRIHAVNGQEARIQIGEQLGFRVTTTTETSTLESIQFLDVGVVLRVTPRITRDGRVLMRIKPEVSTGQVNPDTGLPSEETTEVETDVMMSDGQGLVIGGLIQEKDSNIQSKIPLLGSIPYVGVLFQRRTVELARTEIIVTLIPHVLPYQPILQARNDAEVQRTIDPLTQGALYSAPRPYEPKMIDSLTNPPRYCLAARTCDAAVTPASAETEFESPASLPPVEDCPSCEPEPDAASTAPLPFGPSVLPPPGR